MKQLRLFQSDDPIKHKPMQTTRFLERNRLEEKYSRFIKEELRLAGLVSYVGNKHVPLLRLYRYKEAFSLRLVEEFISRLKLDETDLIFDPFCGMGTTLFCASQKGISSIGLDRLPIAVFTAKTLSTFLLVEPGQIRKSFEKMRRRVHLSPLAPVAMDVAIMKIAFPPETLINLRKWKAVIDELENPLKDIFLLLFFSILEACSYTSKDGQFLRLMRDKKVANPADALEKKVIEAEEDINLIRLLRWDKSLKFPNVYTGDSRHLDSIVFDRQPTAIITSPPYVNRYDYTRTYSLELCFHFVMNFSELKNLRLSVLRSHIESKLSINEYPPHSAVEELVEYLQSRGKALNNPRIPDMIIGYFVDMKKVIHEWAKVLAPESQVVMVVDNVRFEGESLPVDLILSEIAEQVGFETKSILVARYKGNSSQQMGKYGRVPVRESIVIWRKL